MTYKLSVKAEAIQDMTEAFEWYETRQTGLGIEFLDEVDACLSRISTNPEHYQIHRNQRIAILHRFPYKVVYEIEKHAIVIYAVYHDKQNPEELSKRE